MRVSNLGFLSIMVGVEGFVARHLLSSRSLLVHEASTKAESEELQLQKKKLFELLGKQSTKDLVLADPITKENIEIISSGVLLGDGPNRIQYQISSPSNKFKGSSDTFINLLEPLEENDDSNASQSPLDGLMKQALPYVPPPLRGPLASLTGNEEFVPMRDLFTSPAVSYAYERGWRQGFASAGFPGPDVEADMAMDYFVPVVARTNASVVVDMSCATGKLLLFLLSLTTFGLSKTNHYFLFHWMPSWSFCIIIVTMLSGLFTRRFAVADKYSRVLGCDYSESMLTEARRRINADSKLSKNALKTTNLELVRLDVGQIPMRNESVDCLHAGAAMHCWPDLNAAASEIHRVLKPGGRYFATTFLATYFSTLSNMDGASDSAPSQQAFQYFTSVDTLRDLLERGGFEREKIQIEILGRACVVIRAEK